MCDLTFVVSIVADVLIDLQWLFVPPLPKVISMASYATRLIPLPMLSMFFPDWPHEQLLVLRSLLHSPSAIFAALTLAHDEMNTVKDPDVPLLQTFSNRIHLYYAAHDGWVGEQKDLLLKELELHIDVKIAHGADDIPHAFVISKSLYGETFYFGIYNEVDRSWRTSGSTVP